MLCKKIVQLRYQNRLLLTTICVHSLSVCIIWLCLFTHFCTVDTIEFNQLLGEVFNCSRVGNSSWQQSISSQVYIYHRRWKGKWKSKVCFHWFARHERIWSNLCAIAGVCCYMLFPYSYCYSLLIIIGNWENLEW